MSVCAYRKNVMLTSGASSGLLLVTSLLFPRGSTIFVEDPTYFIAINVLKDDFGMNVVPGTTQEMLIKSVLLTINRWKTK